MMPSTARASTALGVTMAADESRSVPSAAVLESSHTKLGDHVANPTP